MFDIGWSELVVIGVVALIVIGPKELPAVLRTVGQWTTKIRRMAGEFQSQFQEAMREAEMADLKKQVDELDDAAKGIATDFDPLDLNEATKWEPKTTLPRRTRLTGSNPLPRLRRRRRRRMPQRPPSLSHQARRNRRPRQVRPRVPPPAADAGSTAEPAAVPLAEGSGRA